MATEVNLEANIDWGSGAGAGVAECAAREFGTRARKACVSDGSNDDSSCGGREDTTQGNTGIARAGDFSEAATARVPQPTLDSGEGELRLREAIDQEGGRKWKTRRRRKRGGDKTPNGDKSDQRAASKTCQSIDGPSQNTATLVGTDQEGPEVPCQNEAALDGSEHTEHTESQNKAESQNEATSSKQTAPGGPNVEGNSIDGSCQHGTAPTRGQRALPERGCARTMMRRRARTRPRQRCIARTMQHQRSDEAGVASQNKTAVVEMKTCARKNEVASQNEAAAAEMETCDRENRVLCRNEATQNNAGPDESNNGFCRQNEAATYAEGQQTEDDGIRRRRVRFATREATKSILKWPGLDPPQLSAGQPVTGATKEQHRIKNKEKRVAAQERAEQQSFWTVHRGTFSVPMPKQTCKEYRGQMRPKGLALEHPASENSTRLCNGWLPCQRGSPMDGCRNRGSGRMRATCLGLGPGCYGATSSRGCREGGETTGASGKLG